jgi:hypothetical protein
MAESKSIIMSLSVTQDVRDTLRISAKNKGVSVSSLVRELVEKHLSLVVPEGNEIPVILKIPGELKGKEEELRHWLEVKSNTIVKALVK